MEMFAVIGAAVIAVNFAIAKSARKYWPWFLLIVLGLYGFLCVASLLTAQGEEGALILARLAFVACCVSFIGLCRAVRRFDLVIVFLRIAVFSVCVINILEFSDPFFLKLPLSTDLPRVAGFYQNPNVSSMTIASALPLIVFNAKTRLRLLSYAITFAGILPTASRGGLLIWILIVLLGANLRFDARGRARIVALWVAASIAAAIGILFGGLILNMLGSTLDAETFARYVTLNDYAANGRRFGAQMAWDIFTRSPLLGEGVGCDVINTAYDGPHNMFLLMLSELGIFGGAFFLTFLFALYKMGSGRNLALVLIFGACSLFSHNLFDQPYWAILLAMYWRVSLVPEAQGVAVSRAPVRVRARLSAR